MLIDAMLCYVCLYAKMYTPCYSQEWRANWLGHITYQYNTCYRLLLSMLLRIIWSAPQESNLPLLCAISYYICHPLSTGNACCVQCCAFIQHQSTPNATFGTIELAIFWRFPAFSENHLQLTTTTMCRLQMIRRMLWCMEQCLRLAAWSC